MGRLPVIACIVAAPWLVATCGCRRPDVVETAVDDARIGQAPADAGRGRDMPRTHITIDDLEALDVDDSHDRWLRVEDIADGAEGGWATGAFMPGNKVVIETENVTQFALDLPRIPIDWDRRVILCIDGHTSELTRKHYPHLRLRRSPTGGWTPVKDGDHGGD